jgi:hypothetical protein
MDRAFPAVQDRGEPLLCWQQGARELPRHDPAGQYPHQQRSRGERAAHQGEHRETALPVDFFLGAHGSYFDLEAKYSRLKDGSASPFIDPAGYKKFVDGAEQGFRDELAKQQAAAKK